MGFELIRKKDVSADEYQKLCKKRKQQRKLLKKIKQVHSEQNRIDHEWLGQNRSLNEKV